MHGTHNLKKFKKLYYNREQKASTCCSHCSKIESLRFTKLYQLRSLQFSSSENFQPNSVTIIVWCDLN